MEAKKAAREYLLEAIQELLSKKPIEEITVAELTGITGVSRTTFYKHFADKQALAEQVFIDELSDELFFGTASMLEREVEILERIDANRQFYRNAVRSSEFVRSWMEKALESDVRYLRSKLEGRDVSEAMLRDCAYLITRTLADATLDWARNRPDRDTREYARTLVTYCEGGLAALLGEPVVGF